MNRRKEAPGQGGLFDLAPDRAADLGEMPGQGFLPVITAPQLVNSVPSAPAPSRDADRAVILERLNVLAAARSYLTDAAGRRDARRAAAGGIYCWDCFGTGVCSCPPWEWNEPAEIQCAVCCCPLNGRQAYVPDGRLVCLECEPERGI